MKSEEKDAIMQAFKEHQIDVLVSTTVIEVGVNVPNATVMVIVDADRLALVNSISSEAGSVGEISNLCYPSCES